jgi:hypothetical protein
MVEIETECSKDGLGLQVQATWIAGIFFLSALFTESNEALMTQLVPDFFH